MSTGLTTKGNGPTATETPVDFVPSPEDTEAAPPEPELVTFSDVVRAHRTWERDVYEHERHPDQPCDPAVEDDFHRRWRAFEGQFGRIDDAYWSILEVYRRRAEPVRR
jgi:hypothetical protein